jgi:abhydrolase domain-containing protein 17
VDHRDQRLKHLCFQPPRPPSYGHSHPRLTMIGPPDHEVALMSYMVDPHRPTILYGHGNACDIGQMDAFFKQYLSKELNVNIVSYDYEGYGLSRSQDPDGKPTEHGCNRATEAAYNYLADDLKIQPSDVILYGTSIGTGPIVKLGAVLAERGIDVRGILLQTPYSSVFGVVSELCETSCYYADSVIESPNMFKSGEEIVKIKSPITIVHGLRDEVIPYVNAERLHRAAKNSKLVTIPTARHGNIESVPEHYVILKQAIKDLIA